MLADASAVLLSLADAVVDVVVLVVVVVLVMLFGPFLPDFVADNEKVEYRR